MKTYILFTLFLSGCVRDKFNLCANPDASHSGCPKVDAAADQDVGADVVEGG